MTVGWEKERFILHKLEQSGTGSMLTSGSLETDRIGLLLVNRDGFCSRKQGILFTFLKILFGLWWHILIVCLQGGLDLLGDVGVGNKAFLEDRKEILAQAQLEIQTNF